MAEYFAGGHLRFVNDEWRDDNGDAIEISRVRHGRGRRRTMNFAPAQYANILFMWGGIKQTTAHTAARLWIRRNNHV